MIKKIKRTYTAISILQVICIVFALIFIVCTIGKFQVIPNALSIITFILSGIILWISIINLIKCSMVLLFTDFAERIKELSDAESENKE